MVSYVVCPSRGERKVALKVCLVVCQDRDSCQEFKEVPEEDVQAALEEVDKLPAVSDDALIDGVEIIGNDELEKDSSGKKDSQEAEHAALLLQRAIAIKNEVEAKFWEMGSILSDIFKNQYYVDYGYYDWKEFCNEVLEMKWRTATYLRDIYVKFTSLGIGPDDCVGVGWGKLKELLPIVTKENVRYWLEQAKERKVGVAELNAKVRYALGKISKEESERLPSQLVFRLYEAQLENVERALELARRMTGSDSRAYHLEMICAEFRATYEATEGEYTKRKLATDLLGKIETLLSVKFKGDLIDEFTGEVIKKA